MSRERRQEFVKTATPPRRGGPRARPQRPPRRARSRRKRRKIPEDETKRLEKDIQTATDKAIKDIGDHLAHKEKELLTV